MADIEVRAEWPGRVAELLSAVGDAVEAEQEVMTVESMKMMTPVPAPSAGTIASIDVEIDQFVDEGDLLLTMNN